MAEMRMRDALREALREEMLRDERVFLMGEDIGAYGGSYAVTKGLLDEFGEERVRDTPIAESGMVGIGIGAAMGGMHPMVEMMTINFSFLALDQIVNSAAKLYHMSNGQINVPMVVRMASGGGSQLAATHSHSLEGLYAHFPGLKVVCPSNAADAKGLLKRAFRDENTVIFIEHTANYALKGEVPDDPDYLVEFGVANTLRSGSDVTIVGYSGSVHQAMRAARMLEEQEEIDAEVIDLRTIRPLDIDTVVNSVKKTNRAVIVEDDWLFGGFGGELSAQIMERAFDYLDAPVARVSSKDVPLPYNRNLEFAALPSEEDVVEAVLRMFKE
ncbi:MAG: alpha-ketoacid dehydrogenase subunit beta [Dehalococcoidia bacterium]|uniref:alpha-ketoacid dehydrogenase subunit beta n=1 Tax=Candidatus Amarobacter glycogenicus TaxID=3140699 RepID=UPI001D308989|nr:alpha-ketoacid dehydrogenase subunit beta [Dehalococcoidia bacterium]MBK7125193.1 alpha-ketoacid dehydrogenase subunit beta [Dehalococcoidia bacterium]MBK7726871.1 alpha-ketoacid dehydrogenase subunit beta [Dehalococcoidia bacterium]MBK8558758.1 alpha-ketoacid dehydrogenase subunit beta [Dehalococcoidia bacterium]MBK9545303.1 alpha-ketoacid dehydrogenase subunit beta [Dehalococcoidia bacterium]